MLLCFPANSMDLRNVESYADMMEKRFLMKMQALSYILTFRAAYLFLQIGSSLCSCLSERHFKVSTNSIKLSI